jgi:TPR repeat protein
MSKKNVDDILDKLEEASAAFSAENFALALEILEPLVAHSVPGALGMLGVAYQLGLGVERNGPKAVELLLKATELGDGTAAHNLGTIYVTGMPGIEANKEQSKKFYRKAKELGAQFADDAFYE